MAEDELKQLLDQANELAGQEKWQEALEKLNAALKLEPENLGILNGIGTCQLRMESLSEAAATFNLMLKIDPKMADIYCNLGVIYALMGQPDQAESAYQDALELDANHRFSWRGLAQLYILQPDHLMDAIEILTTLMKNDPQDVETVVLLACVYEQENQAEMAEKLYKYVLNLQPGNLIAEEGLKRITPVDSPQTVKREYAKKLASLKSLRSEKPMPSVILYGGDELAVAFRLFSLVKGMERIGLKVKYSNQFSPADLDLYNTFVFSRPQLTEDLTNAYEACVNTGKQVVFDVDEDFHNLPESHPGFNIFGKGNPRYLKRLELMLQDATLVTASSKVLAEHYQNFCKKIEYIPGGWDDENPMWDTPAEQKNTVNIGWVDLPTERVNLELIKNELAQVLKKLPQARLVIGGDLGAYETFRTVIPEEQFRFVPFVSFEDYPFIYSGFDIVVSPAYGNPYNLAKHDLRLMEAGIRKIPWVASPIPSYKEWQEGGMMVKRGDEWVSALRKLITDPDLRASLGQAGRQKAEGRKIEIIARMWRDVLMAL